MADPFFLSRTIPGTQRRPALCVAKEKEKESPAGILSLGGGSCFSTAMVQDGVAAAGALRSKEK